MRIYRGSDADIVLRPFMVRLSEIVSFDLQLWTSGTYTVKRSTSESGMTTDKENNLINVHFTDKETGYLDAGVLNAKLMYRITDSEYPDGTYDGIITIPQEYYLMTPPDFSGATIEKVYESGYTEGYNTAIQNSVLSINGEKGDLKLKTVNGNELLGEGDINIKALKYFELTQERAREAYDEIQNHWDDKSGYTGDFIFYYKKENRSVYTFDEMGYIKDHSIYFSWLDNADAYDMNGNVKCFAIIIWKDGYNLRTYENDFAIPTKISQLTNDSAFQTKSEVDTAIENAISGVGGVESLNNQTGALKLKTIDNKDVLGEGNMDILSDYNICMFMMYNLTLSEADKGVDLYKYGIGDDAANLDKYFSGLKTIQFLHFNIKDGASYKVPLTIFWDGDGNRQFRFVCEGYEYTYTSTDANYCDFTSKVKVGGDQNVIVLDNLTQEERKAVYDKLDKTKNPDEVFFYNNTASVSAFWDGSKYLKFITIGEYYKGLKTTMYSLAPNGSLDEEDWGMRYTNTLTIFLRNHVNETDPFECEYNGSFYEYLVRPYTRPNAYFIWFWKGYGASTKPVYVPFSVEWDKYYDTEGEGPITIQFTIDGVTYKYRNDLTKENYWQYDGKISIYDSHSINGFNGTSLVLGGAALDETDKNKYIDMRAMMGHDTIFNGDNDGSCPYLTIITTDNQMYKVPVWVKCNKQNDSTTRATFEFDLNGYHYLYTQDNQGDLTYSFTSKTPIGGGTSGDVPTKVSQLENDSKYINQSSQSSTYNIEHMWVGNQSQYDALETKDARTLFIII